MPHFKVNYTVGIGSFAKGIHTMGDDVAEAITGAMRDAGTGIKTRARADIARAGFSTRWQNALRVTSYPKQGISSLEPAVQLVHNIQYANVFEDGDRVQGKPMLWIPLDGTPKRIGRNLMTAQRFNDQVNDLVTMRSRDGLPLLGAYIKVPKKAADAPVEQLRVTLSSLRRGLSGKTGVRRLVPLFFGVRSVDLPKKFSIGQVMQKAVDDLPRLYDLHIKGAL